MTVLADCIPHGNGSCTFPSRLRCKYASVPGHRKHNMRKRLAYIWIFNAQLQGHETPDWTASTLNIVRSSPGFFRGRLQDLPWAPKQKKRVKQF